MHKRLIASDKYYKERVRLGQTTAFAKPYQDIDENGKPISSNWYVNCKDRYQAVMTAAELSQLKS